MNATYQPIERCGGFAAAPFLLAGHVRTALGALSVLLFLTGLPGELRADPYRPASDATVLATVPRAEIAQRDAVTRLSRALAAAPDSADVAASLARIYIDLHGEVGDPRYLGYADAVITKFTAQPTLEIQLVQANLLQAGHQFEAARTILESVVRSNPDEARAWLMLAAIAAIQADYAVSRNACARLYLLGNKFEALTCSAEIASLTGRSQEAYEQLVEALDAGVAQPAPLRAWAHTVAAEIAQRRGDPDAAQAHFEAALDTKTSIYALVGLADVLIGRQQYDQALKLLQDKPAADAVILRRAVALERLGEPDAGLLAQQAARRIEALRQRGDNRHAREEAFFALYIGDQWDDAVASALRNWQMQRESIDALLLLRAAAAAGNPAAAAPVMQWMRVNDSDDIRLLQLATQLQVRS